MDCETIGDRQEFYIVLDRSDLDTFQLFKAKYDSQKPESISASLLGENARLGNINQDILNQIDLYKNDIQNQEEYLLVSEPNFIEDEEQELTFFVLEGGQVIPGKAF